MDIVLQEGNNTLDVALVPIPPPVANLYGVVTDSETGLPIEGVMVTMNGSVVYTDSSGSFSFVGFAPGPYTIIFEKDGYETQ